MGGGSLSITSYSYARFMPSCRKQTFASSDHLVCDQQKIARYRQAEIFSCLEVGNELEFGRNLNWQIIRRRPPVAQHKKGRARTYRSRRASCLYLRSGETR